MKCKVSFEFETEGDMTKWLNAKSPMASVAVETMEKGIEEAESVKAPAVVEPEPVRAPEPEPMPEPEAPKAKAPKAKAPAVVETLNPEAPTQKERDKALALLTGKIRGFVLADKSTNMRILMPLMPEGKRALDKLTLEEAQGIVLKLGID